MKFYIVDAFTETLFGGNPAGVVIMERGRDFPQDEIMQKTAAELRYSETAFIKPLAENHFQIRYFTPVAEVELCGHATIGSFCALRKEGLVKAGFSYLNNTLAGQLNIEVLEKSVLMEMGKAECKKTIETTEQLEELYGVMGLSFRQEQGRAVNRNGETVHLLPEMVSTGLLDIIMPVADENELAAIKPDFSALSKLSERYRVVGVHAFAVTGGNKAVHCRNFAPLYDIDEEAATGTSNGALTYYLYKNGLVPEGVENVFIQGEAMGRPSKITSKLTVQGEEAKIQVGGQAVILAEGNIYL